MWFNSSSPWCNDQGSWDPLVNVMRWRFACKDQRIRPSINRKPMSTSSNIFCLGLQGTFQPLGEYSFAKSFEKLSFSLGWFDILLAGDWRMSSRWGLRIFLQKYITIVHMHYADFKGGMSSIWVYDYINIIWIHGYMLTSWVFWHLWRGIGWHIITSVQECSCTGVHDDAMSGLIFSWQ